VGGGRIAGLGGEGAEGVSVGRGHVESMIAGYTGGAKFATSLMTIELS